MEFYKEIVIQLLQNKEISMDAFADHESLYKILENKCYLTLKEIKNILEDDTLEDPECFMKIEQIVCAFEELGSDCGTRHDF